MATSELAALRIQWRGVLYSDEAHAKLGRIRVGPFGWLGITRDKRDSGHHLLRVTYKSKKLRSVVEPMPVDSPEHEEAVLLLVRQLVQAHEAQG